MRLLFTSPGPCITNVFATRRKNFSQWYRSFQTKLLSHWQKFLRLVAITLVIQGPGLPGNRQPWCLLDTLNGSFSFMGTECKYKCTRYCNIFSCFLWNFNTWKVNIILQIRSKEVSNNTRFSCFDNTHVQCPHQQFCRVYYHALPSWFYLDWLQQFFTDLR